MKIPMPPPPKLQPCEHVEKPWELTPSTIAWVLIASPYSLIGYLYQRITNKHMHIYTNIYYEVGDMQGYVMSLVFAFHVSFWWSMLTMSDLSSTTLFVIPFIVFALIKLADSMGAKHQFAAYTRFIGRFKEMEVKA